jgi:hypothetical protein
MNSEGSSAYQSAFAYCRVSSRRAELAGANAPLSYSVTLMQAAAPPELNSTQRIRLALDHVMGLDRTPEDIVAEWEGRRPEQEDRRNKALERVRSERKEEPKAEVPGSERGA